MILQPRLGPKPFTPPKFNESESFDKVFSVPAVPGTNSTNGVTETPKLEEKITPPQQHQQEEEETPDCDVNGKIEEDDYVPKTPSTAERRKLFENRSNSKENNEQDDNFDAADASSNFERSSTQRSSIAERRKMYERSQSMQDAPPVAEKPEGSPVMLRRKDSLKNRKGEEETRKSVPFAKQQSLDPQAQRKTEAVAPTPKRTSTVFGECDG